MSRALRSWWRVPAETFQRFVDLQGAFLSAGLAFNILLYCFPLLLLFVTALGYLVEESDLSTVAVRNLLGRLFPASEAAIGETLESFAENRGLMSVVSVVGFVLFGTFLFGSVRHVLNVVFVSERRRTFLRGFGADLVAMFGTGGLLAIAAGLASALALVVEIVSRLPAHRSWMEPGWAFLGRLVTFLFAGALLYLLFHVAPSRKLSRQSLLFASLAGAVLLEISKWIFSWYVQQAREYAVLYGALGGLVFFVLWIYYASLVFVLAATLGSVLESRRGNQGQALISEK